MIVPSMTVQEIHKEVMEDLRSIADKIKDYKEEFEKIVQKSTHFPVTKVYHYDTLKKKNRFTITFMAPTISHWDKPILSMYTVYKRPEGKYAVAPAIELNLISIYPPHFFKRYRDRILKNKALSNEEVINHYFDKDWGFMGTVVNDKFESVFHSFEQMHKDEKISFVAATSQGFCFGERQGCVNIIKTIISEDMLYDDQIDTFTSLKKQFIVANSEKYGKVL